MRTAEIWIVCEVSGRWAAALRMAFARLPVAQYAPRLYEVQSLAELTALMDEHRNGLGLIEVRRTNLAEVLEVLADEPFARFGRFAALLDDNLWQANQDSAAILDSDKQQIIDLLWEAGAAEVVESPRHLRGLLALRECLEAVATRAAARSAESQDIADWAWSILPWQP